MGKDYYKTLGIDKQASQDEIKRAFHKKAHQYHPDKANGDAEKFKEINEAYQVLSNPQKRQQYDQFGSTFSQNGGNGSGFGGFQGGGFNINMDDLGEMFSGMGGIGDIFGFGNRQSNTRNKRGHDIEVLLSLDFNEAIFGIEKTIKLNKAVKCDQCDGSGAEPGSKTETCSSCKGSGRITKVQRTILGAMQVQTACPDCQGEGQKISQKCSKCHGQGKVQDKVELKVKIPAGIDDGETIRLSGQGEAGYKGNNSGDLYLRIQVKTDKRFKREDYDILSQAEISLTQAVLGDKIEIETIDGKVDLKIPAGTESNKQFILRNRGITRLQGRGKGDHIVTVKIKVPSSLNRKQRKLLEELKENGL